MNILNLNALGTAYGHPISISNGSVRINGFPFGTANNVYSQISYGNAYLKYGIADGSVLLCCSDLDIMDGDLVLAGGGFNPSICRYFANPEISSDSAEQVVHDKRDIAAKIIASFNFYL